MASRWLAALGLLCVLASTAHSAALSTEDTLVVARYEDEAKPTQPPETEEPTTEEPNVPIKVTEMEVESEIALRYARTWVAARVHNPARRAQEASFRVLLPDTAFISGFTMTLAGKSYKAYVKEKEEAKQIYSDAISRGIGAAHIATKARDSNHFTVSVNVEANTTAVFNLTYEELLARRNGVYSHAVNLHPGAPVPRLAVTVRVRETQRLQSLRVPPVRTGNEVDSDDDTAQNPIARIERSADGRGATITFKPDLDEQRRLSEIYTAKSKESQSNFRYGYGYDRQDEAESDQEGALGQFVVQYDVERPKDGEVLVNDGYFVHFLAPSSLPPINKHVVFVLDTSGSMMGRKVEQLKQAMVTILDELNKGDYFSIVEFNSNVKVHNLNQADIPPQPHPYYRSYFDMNEEYKPSLVPPALATPENIAKAKKIIDNLNAGGGTNIDAALNLALDLVQKGVEWTLPSTPVPAVANDNASPTTEETQDIIVTPKKSEGGHQDKAISKQNEPKELEPMLIFLTDGEPNEGESRPDMIIKQITEKNSSKKRASIFSLAFGESADRSFLRKLSLRNEGFMRHIYEAADAALQLRAFYRQVASPLLADVTFVYPPDQVKEGSLTKTKFRTVYGGSETVVAGRVADLSTELAPRVVAVCGVDDSFSRERYEVMPVRSQASGHLPLERLWAYLTIKQLLDARDAGSGESDKDSTSPAKKALELALKYEFVTPLTSLVVVKPNATDAAVDAESVDKQSSRPSAFSTAALQSSYVPQRNAFPTAALQSSYASRPSAFSTAALQPVFDFVPMLDYRAGQPAASVYSSFGSNVAYAAPLPAAAGGPILPADRDQDEWAIPNHGPVLQASTPCVPNPCGPNSICRPVNSQSVCSCEPNFIGAPPACRPECTVSSECLLSKACYNQKCVDPCPGSCGSNANCKVINHNPICACDVGLTGDPFVRCVPIAYPVPQITTPCVPNPCGPNSICRPVNSQSVCSCEPNFIGAPPACRPECTVSSECPLSKACINQKCSEPCLGTCGLNANCQVINHTPICSCDVDFTGNPFLLCALLQTAYPELSAETTTGRPVLAQYHLEHFPWVAALLNASTGHIAVPQTAALLQLTLHDEAPKAPGDDEACARATDGAVGRCVYLTRCRSARGITTAQYTGLHCAVNNKYAGVCCPKDEIDVTTT